MFCEGMIFAIRKNIVKYDTSKYGYYIDVFQGYISNILGYKNIIDDSISVYYPYTKSYSDKKAKIDGKEFIKSKGISFYKFCRKLGLCTNFIERLIVRILKRDKLYYK